MLRQVWEQDLQREQYWERYVLALHKANVKTYKEDYNDTSDLVVNRTYAFVEVSVEYLHQQTYAVVEVYFNQQTYTFVEVSVVYYSDPRTYAFVEVNVEYLHQRTYAVVEMYLHQ